MFDTALLSLFCASVLLLLDLLFFDEDLSPEFGLVEVSDFDLFLDDVSATGNTILLD